MTTNKDRDMIISKNIHLSNCAYEFDVTEATNFVMKWIETDEFQSGDMKLELHVYASYRDYDISLYRDDNAMHIWFDGNFAFEIELNSGALRHTVECLFRNWRGVPGIQMFYRGDWNDPELIWSGLKANYREVEDYLYEDFIDGLKASNKYNQYSKLKKSLQDKKFNDWLFDHYYRIVEIFLQLRDLNEH